jgi:hypothetical protein
MDEYEGFIHADFWEEFYRLMSPIVGREEHVMWTVEHAKLHFLDRCFASCWTYWATEREELWDEYAPGQGILLKTDVGALYESLSRGAHLPSSARRCAIRTMRRAAKIDCMRLPSGVTHRSGRPTRWRSSQKPITGLQLYLSTSATTASSSQKGRALLMKRSFASYSQLSIESTWSERHSSQTERTGEGLTSVLHRDARTRPWRV